MKRIGHFAFAATLWIGDAVGAPRELDSLKFKFEVRLKAIEASRAKLDSSYEKALKEYEARVKESGDLTLTLAVRDELEQFRTGPSKVDTGAGRLGKLRTIYERNLEKQALEDRREKQALYANYTSDLDSLRQELTKAGETEGAGAVATEFTSAEKLLANLRDGEWVDLKTHSPTSIASTYKRFEERLKAPTPRTIDGKEYDSSEFIFAHAPSEIQYNFRERIRQFRATIALHDEVVSVGDVVFKVKTDEGVVFTSKRISGKTSMTQVIDLRFDPTSTLTLVTDPNGNISADHAIWLKPEIRRW